jgi:hypothetical protein
MRMGKKMVREKGEEKKKREKLVALLLSLYCQL